MVDSWDSRTVARNLLSLIPRFMRTMALQTQVVSDEDDTTIIQGFTLFTLLDEPMTVSDLARKRHVSLQSASKLVQVLVDRGWVSRVRKADDRRQYLLEVTDEGRARAKEMKTMFLNYAADLVNGLTDEEMAAAQLFLPALERVLNELAISGADSRCT